MATWEVIAGGTTYNLTDRNPFDLVSASGVGLSPVRLLSQRGPLQHGETVLGYRLDPRQINLVVAFKAASLALADTARDMLSLMFGPHGSTTPLTLRVTRDDGSVRQLDCRSYGVIDYPNTQEDRYGRMQRAGVQLLASEPNWYDPTSNLSSFSLSSLVAGMAVPMVVPLLFTSGTTGGGAVQVPYSGTFDEYPVIIATGPIANLLIENETSGDTLSFNGYTLPAGKTLTIDLRYGYKTIIDSDGVNRIASLTSDSDLATWRLLSILETGDGYNSVEISGSSLTAASAASLTYYDRYLSL